MKLKRYAFIYLGVVLLALAMPTSAAAQADVLQWETVDIPGPIGNIVIKKSELSDFAVGAGQYPVCRRQR